MATAKSSSTRNREEGNKYYDKANAAGIVASLRMSRMEDALRCYNRAVQEAANKAEFASATKNAAKAEWAIGKEKSKSDSNVEQVVHYYKEAFKHFGTALTAGASTKSLEWSQDVTSSYQHCLYDAIEALNQIEYLKRIAYLEVFSHVVSVNNLKVKLYLEMATALVYRGITALVSKDFKITLHAMAESYRPIEEIKRLGELSRDVQEELNVLENDVIYHTATAESLQAIYTGDDLLETLLKNEENLNMDMVFEVVDWYKTAIIKAREIETECEAIAASRLGKLYDQVLKIKYKAKDYFQLSLQLAHSMTPRNFTTEGWFRIARYFIEKFQKETVAHQQEEEQKEKQHYLEELKEELDDLKKKIDERSNDAELLIYVYKTFPPINKNHKLPEEDKLMKMDKKELKKVFLKAVTHYHPDKQDEEKQGKKWKVLCEEITKRFTAIYECYKLAD